MKKIIIVLFSLVAISCQPEVQWVDKKGQKYYFQERCIHPHWIGKMRICDARVNDTIKIQP